MENKSHNTEKGMRLVLFTELLLKVKNNNKSDTNFSRELLRNWDLKSIVTLLG